MFIAPVPSQLYNKTNALFRDRGPRTIQSNAQSSFNRRNETTDAVAVRSESLLTHALVLVNANLVWNPTIYTVVSENELALWAMDGYDPLKDREYSILVSIDGYLVE